MSKISSGAASVALMAALTLVTSARADEAAPPAASGTNTTVTAKAVTETNGTVTVTVTVTNPGSTNVTVTQVTATNPTPPPPPPLPVAEKPKSPWESSAALGLTITRGNSDTALFTAKVDAARKTDKTELTLGGDVAYGENAGVKNTESYHAFSQFNKLLSEKTFVYVRVDGLRDEIAGLDYRLTFSPGVGYYFIKNDTTMLSVEAGPGVVYERQAGSKPETYGTLRLAEKFEHKVNDHVKIWQSVEVLPQLDRWKNYVVNSEIGVEAQMTTKASLRVYAQDTYDNEPAPGRKANDLKLVAALAYKF